MENVSKLRRIIEFMLIFIYFLFFLLFAFSWASYSADYNVAIDPANGDGYTPFANKHSRWLIVFFIHCLGSQLLVWLKGKRQPPLLFVMELSCIFIGICISSAVLLQVSKNTESHDSFFFLLPMYYIIISIILIISIIKEDSSYAFQRTYQNKYLNLLNSLMAKSYLQPLWILVLMIPIFLIVMCLLTLLGQDVHAITKVFTETTTWNYSQKTHPPFLDHKGHYLCTVAACGTPKVVKPIRLGHRGGHEIIVNRQLQIANAFEELLEKNFTRLHFIIRKLYDKHGYPLSKKITTPVYSNLVYLCMKPLEYSFLIILYLCCVTPEERIAKQYL